MECEIRVGKIYIRRDGDVVTVWGDLLSTISKELSDGEELEVDVVAVLRVSTYSPSGDDV